MIGNKTKRSLKAHIKKEFKKSGEKSMRETINNWIGQSDSNDLEKLRTKIANDNL